MMELKSPWMKIADEKLALISFMYWTIFLWILMHLISSSTFAASSIFPIIFIRTESSLINPNETNENHRQNVQSYTDGTDVIRNGNQVIRREPKVETCFCVEWKPNFCVMFVWKNWNKSTACDSQHRWQPIHFVNFVDGLSWRSYMVAIFEPHVSTEHQQLF